MPPKRLTTAECQEWIDECAHQSKEMGSHYLRHDLNWMVLPRRIDAHNDNEEDPRKAMITKALANTIFTKNPKYTMFSLKFYKILMDKFRSSARLHPYADQYVVLIKGSNGYKYIIEDQYHEEFSWSDTDIVIYINPSMPQMIFEEIQSYLHINTVIAISEFKRGYDQMFFLKDAKPDYRFDKQELAEEFKLDFQKELDSLIDPSGRFVFPCRLDGGLCTEAQKAASEVYRNNCSRNSFVLVSSQNDRHQDKVVLVEVPHYPESDKSKFGLIPLQKTPLYTSYNKTIKFDRDDEGTIAEFSLYRIRLNIEFEMEDKYEKIPADLIDLCMPAQSDSELQDFWKHGRWTMVKEKISGYQIAIPNIDTCIRDLDKMLHKYDSPDSKKEKRARQLQILKEYRFAVANS